MTATHLCLGVGQCCDCDPRELVIVELTYHHVDPDATIAKVDRVINDTLGVELDRPTVAQPGFVDGDSFVIAVLRITDHKLLPDEKHVDPEDGPSITGGILESIMEHADAFAGSAGWLVRE